MARFLFGQKRTNYETEFGLGKVGDNPISLASKPHHVAAVQLHDMRDMRAIGCGLG